MKRTRFYFYACLCIWICCSLCGCSRNQVYRFQSTCPVSKVAQDIVVIDLKTHCLFAGFDSLGKLDTLHSIGFNFDPPGGLSSNEEEALDNFVLIEEVFDQESEVVLMRGYFLLGNQGILPAQIPKIIPSIKKDQHIYIPCPGALGSPARRRGRASSSFW